MDDVFQAVGPDKAETYTTAKLIKYPPGECKRIVVTVASGEGVTWEGVGRHGWADVFVMWNMPQDGFEQLYRLLPEPKPPFEDVWRLTGGNPNALERLCKSDWSDEAVLSRVVREKSLYEWVSTLDPHTRGLLEEALEDPDAIFRRLRGEAARRLRDELIARNLISRMWERDVFGWVDVPPPKRDPELSIGKFYAWQTPLHREAVRRVLKRV